MLCGRTTFCLYVVTPSTVLHLSAPVPDDEEDDGELSDDSSFDGGSDPRALAPVVSTINFVDLAGSERLPQAASEDSADRDKLKKEKLLKQEVGSLARGAGSTPQARWPGPEPGVSSVLSWVETIL